MKSYRHARQHGLINAGEIAGYTDDDAATLLARGILEPINASDLPATNKKKPDRKRGRPSKPKDTEK